MIELWKLISEVEKISLITGVLLVIVASIALIVTGAIYSPLYVFALLYLVVGMAVPFFRAYRRMSSSNERPTKHDV